MTNFTAQTTSPAYRKTGRSVFRAAYPAEQAFRCNSGRSSVSDAAEAHALFSPVRRPYTYVLYNKRKTARISTGLGTSA